MYINSIIQAVADFEKRALLPLIPAAVGYAYAPAGKGFRGAAGATLGSLLGSTLGGTGGFLLSLPFSNPLVRSILAGIGSGAGAIYGGIKGYQKALE
jgi:hypothetical protein